MPVWIFANLLHGSKGEMDLHKIDRALNSTMKADQISTIIGKTSNYKLLNEVSFHSAIIPTISYRKNLSYTKFPSFFGKLSASNKRKRLVIELGSCYSVKSGFLSTSSVIQ